MLRHLANHFPQYNEEMALRYGIAYHDCIYKIGYPYNEVASAVAANEELENYGVEQQVIERTLGLIMVTKNHVPTSDELSNVIIDLDLAEMGTDNYITNSHLIRKEFSAVSDEQWRLGRMAFLNSFLARDTIFTTEIGRELWEDKARDNMKKERLYLQVTA